MSAIETVEALDLKLCQLIFLYILGDDSMHQNIGSLAGIDHVKPLLKIQIKEWKEYFELDSEVEGDDWVTGSMLSSQIFRNDTY